MVRSDWRRRIKWRRRGVDDIRRVAFVIVVVAGSLIGGAIWATKALARHTTNWTDGDSPHTTVRPHALHTLRTAEIEMRDRWLVAVGPRVDTPEQLMDFHAWGQQLKSQLVAVVR